MFKRELKMLGADTTDLLLKRILSVLICARVREEVADARFLLGELFVVGFFFFD